MRNHVVALDNLKGGIMYAIEFQANIKNGLIEIPELYRSFLQNNVKVIILTEEKRETSSDIIEELLNSPVKLAEFTPFERDEIYELNR